MARGKGEGSIYQDSRGLWRASVELPPALDGKRRRKIISSKTKAGVVKKLRDIQSEKAQYGDLTTRSTTFGQWAEHWITDLAPREVRPKTAAGYRSMLNKQVLPLVKDKRLDTITPQVLRSALDTMSENGAADSYLQQIFGMLSACFRDAINEGILTSSPTDRMKPPRAAAKEAEAFTLEEAVKVLRHAVQDEELGALWCTFLLTGVRRGEGAGLEVDRVRGDAIDLSWQLMHIKPEDAANVPNDYELEHLWGSWYLVRPKSKTSQRLIPRVEPLASILDRHIEHHQPSRFLFTRDGERTISTSAVNRKWNDMVTAAGVERKVPTHGARHTAVDLLYLLEVPEVVIMEIMGHSTLAQTRAYRSRRREISPQAKDAMKQMGDLLDLGEKHSSAALPAS